MIEYPDLNRFDSESGRTYETPDGKRVPSVSTVLGATADSSWIAEWRDSIGRAEADRILEESGSIGRTMHEILEREVAGQPHPLIGAELSETDRIATRLAGAIKLFALSGGKLGEVMGSECKLHYDGLYAGTADVICVYKGQLTVIDFKNSRGKKLREHIGSYFMQAAAYRMAHNWMFPMLPVTQTAIIIASRSGAVSIYASSGEELDGHERDWCLALEKYYETRDVP